MDGREGIARETLAHTGAHFDEDGIWEDVFVKPTWWHQILVRERSEERNSHHHYALRAPEPRLHPHAHLDHCTPPAAVSVCCSPPATPPVHCRSLLRAPRARFVLSAANLLPRTHPAAGATRGSI